MSTVVTEFPSVEIAKLAVDIRKQGGETSRNLAKDLKRPVNVVANTARGNASWSTRIPGAIAVKTSRSVAHPGADIVVSGLGHARLFEGLTKGGRKKFRHPVWGNKSVWVSQSTRPYIRPAQAAHLSEFREAVDKAVLDAAKANGWR